jgi:hypothetical protein
MGERAAIDAKLMQMTPGPPAGLAGGRRGYDSGVALPGERPSVMQDCRLRWYSRTYVRYE